MLRKRFENSALLTFWMVFAASSFAPAQSQPTLTRKWERAEIYDQFLTDVVLGKGHCDSRPTFATAQDRAALRSLKRR